MAGEGRKDKEGVDDDISDEEFVQNIRLAMMKV
jgi:hypothetical protein